MPLRLIESILTFKDGLNNLLISLAIEWRVAAKQDVQDDTTAPKIALLIVTLLQNLWGNIVRSSILLNHFLSGNVLSRSAKVDNCDACLIAWPVEEQIFRLKISMHNISTVAIIYCGEDLFDDVCCILLAKNFLLGNALEKFASVAQSISGDKKRKSRYRGNRSAIQKLTDGAQKK